MPSLFECFKLDYSLALILGKSIRLKKCGSGIFSMEIPLMLRYSCVLMEHQRGDTLMDCPICGSAPRQRFEAKFVTVEQCGSCRHIYAENPGPDQGVQTLVDPDLAFSEYRERNNRLISLWQRGGFLRQDSRVLDVGAGTGHILRSIRGRLPHAQINCTEADHTANSYLRSMNFNVIDGFESAEPKGYDAILLIEVVEHVNDPIEFLRACGKLLRRDGGIFLTTPCGETRSGVRDSLEAYNTPEHIHFWTERSFAICCAKAGFSFRKIEPGIMYPQKSPVIGAVKSVARVLRDQVHGIRHIVGFLKAA